MQLFISYNGRQMEYILPKDVRRAEISLRAVGLNKVMYAERWDVNGKDQWHLVSSTEINVFQVQRNAQNKRVLMPCRGIGLTSQARCVLGLKSNGAQIQVYAQKHITQNQVFNKYRIAELGKVTVGTDTRCSIVLNRKAVSPLHFQIIIQGNEAILHCEKDVYVNNQLVVEDTYLKPFDTICVCGVKFVYLMGILAVNSSDSVQTNLHSINELDLLDTQVDDSIPEDYGDFSRAPRQLISLETEPVNIEAPPAKKNKDETPWFLTIGPTITMPMPMLCAMLINMRNSQAVSGTVSRGLGSYAGIMASMLLTAVLGLFWGQIRRKWQEKQDKKHEEKRVASYNKYIEKTSNLLQERCNAYITETERQYLSSYEMVQQLTHECTWLWNRNTNHSDFGFLRIGTGTVLNQTAIEVPKERFSMDDDDELVETPAKVKEQYKYITDAPVVFNLFNLNTLGVTGSTETMYAMLNSMLVQTAGLYSYTDVKIGICTSHKHKEELMWARFLPHLQLTDIDLRLFVHDYDSRERVSSYIVNLIQSRMESNKENAKEVRQLPHYVFFCTDSTILETDAIRNYANSMENLGITFVLLFGEIASLPNNCTHVLQCDADFVGINVLTEAVDLQCTVDFETLDVFNAEIFARELSGYTVKEAALGVLPTKVTFLETLGITAIEQWDLAQHYREARTYESIRGLIGVGSGGVLKYLDIHEKKHGPHGLIAGMTGSGKSEMLQTIIVSWAMNYSPEELAFVLIDYKGGGMANMFAGMPHVVGVLTNLSDDDEEIEEKQAQTESSENNKGNGITNRALVSIKSEIKRRQKIFKKYKINHIDDYIKMYHRQEVTESLPHLVIISDEFAELRKEQHDFISELVSAARVGRSLGVHLILATQKPAGVVDAEISSNARYRLSLRVQDKSDSMSMLNRPEAAYLTQIGRLYMQVGSDEIFEEIQAAYSGGYYMPQDAKQKASSMTCDMLALDGRIVDIVDKRKKKVDKTKLQTELETCITYVTKQVETLKIPKPAQLWLPFLPKYMYLEDVLNECNLQNDIVQLPYGFVDDVVQQKQYPILLNAVEMGNTLIVGNSGCGKSTLLQTLLYVCATKYQPIDVQYYIYDYSSRILKMFACTAHCGGVIMNDYDDVEKAQRTMQLIFDIMNKRRELFDKADAGSYIEYSTNVEKIPVIYLVIDDYASWNVVHGESMGDQLLQLLRDGSKYGVYVMLTINTMNEISYKLRQYINNYITLSLQDKSAYRDVWGNVPDVMPENYKGRGVTCTATSMAIFQTLLAVKNESAVARNTMIKQDLQIIADSYTGTVKAKQIPVLPKGVSYADLLAQTNALNTSNRNEQMLLGYDTTTMLPLYMPLTDAFMYTISDVSGECRGSLRLLRNMCTLALKRNYIVKYIQLFGDNYSTNEDYVLTTDKQIYQLIKYINDLYVERSNGMKEYLFAHIEDNKAEKVLRQEYVQTVTPVFVYVDSIHTFVQRLQTESFCKLSVSEQTTEAQAIINKTAYKYIISVLERGAGYGVYFVGLFDNEAHSARTLDIYKQFHSSMYGIHFGGCLTMQSYVKGTTVLATYKQQSAVMSDENAIIRNGTVENLVWVP